MTEVVMPIATGVPPVMEAQHDRCDHGSAQSAGRRCSECGSPGFALRWIGGTLGAMGAMWIASSLAFAYHNTTDGGGGAPLDIILPIAGAVAPGMSR